MERKAQKGKGNKNEVNDSPGSLLAEKRFRMALDRTKMPASAQKIGGCIIRFYNEETRYAWLTVERIAFECSCDVSTVYRALEGPLDGWFEIGKIVIKGKERNTYTPNWEKVAAVNHEFNIRLKKWQAAHGDNIDIDNFDEDGTMASQNARSRHRKLRGDDIANCDPIESREQNLSDRAYKNIPEGTSGVFATSEMDSASGADRHGSKKPWPYKQTKAEADQIFECLERMAWKTEADDPDFQPTPKADASARIHWHKLLKSGIAASRIVRCAEKYLREAPENQVASLAGFLGRIAKQCADPEEYYYILDSDQPDRPANDNTQQDYAKVSGSDIPF